MAINQHHAFVAVCFRISKWSRSVAQQRKEESRDMRLRMRALGTHQRTLFIHLKKWVFSRNLGQNMP